ncbi:MAG TPA: DUF962 domain-containing protein [Stellaceae bacterium]|nr:DUF962 domain-containing protein [Stellaceae bacterium]
MAPRFSSFAEFWPYYLSEHRRKGTRALHYLGTSLGVLLLLGALAGSDWRLLVAAPIAGYGFAWLAHAAIEHNRPATFTYPLWSLRGDFVMLYYWATGRLGGELERAKLA